MFIDIHVHVRKAPLPPCAGRSPFCTPEQLLARYDAAGIEQGVLLPLVSPEFYLPQSNDEVLAIAAERPDRFIPFCNVDPRCLTNAPDAPLGELFSHFKARGARGIGEVTANLLLGDPLVQNLFSHAAQADLPVVIHMATRLGGGYGLVDEPGLPELERSLARHPTLKILGHSPVFWSEIAALEKPADRSGYPRYPVAREGVLPRLLRQHPNLYGDLSAGSGHNALARDPAYGARFLAEFQDRLLFGTDLCAPDTPAPLVDLLTQWRAEGRISEAVFNKVARENAIRLLGLQP